MDRTQQHTTTHIAQVISMFLVLFSSNSDMVRANSRMLILNVRNIFFSYFIFLCLFTSEYSFRIPSIISAHCHPPVRRSMIDLPCQSREPSFVAAVMLSSPFSTGATYISEGRLQITRRGYLCSTFPMQRSIWSINQQQTFLLV